MTTAQLATIEGHGAARRVQLRNEFSTSIENTWEAITQVHHVQRWWPDWRAGGRIEPRTGGRIVLDDGAWIDGTIVTWSPPQLFEFTWKDSAEGEDWYEPDSKSLLRIELESLGTAGTGLMLTQYMPFDMAIGGAAGWHHFAGERLKHLLESGEIPADDCRFEELRDLYGKWHPELIKETQHG